MPKSRPVILALNVVLLLAWSGAAAWFWIHPVPPAGMVFVPPGNFFMGQYEVTVGEFGSFVLQAKYHPQGNWQLYQDDPKFPVVGVTYDDAEAYARWKHARLPTEQEWELAARGTDGRFYPWGNDWDPRAANVNTRSVAPVGSYPKDQSPYGVMDCAGNVFEWTSTATSDGGRIIRGGCWLYLKEAAALTFRHRAEANLPSHVIGFRICRSR